MVKCVPIVEGSAGDSQEVTDDLNSLVRTGIHRYTPAFIVHFPLQACGLWH
jgi:hypothetical protein